MKTRKKAKRTVTLAESIDQVLVWAVGRGMTDPIGEVELFSSSSVGEHIAPDLKAAADKFDLLKLPPEELMKQAKAAFYREPMNAGIYPRLSRRSPKRVPLNEQKASHEKSVQFSGGQSAGGQGIGHSD